MRQTQILFSIILLTTTSTLLLAQERHQTPEGLAAARAQLRESNCGYTENRGQLRDQNGIPNPAVRFLYSYRGCNLQLRSNGFSYDSYVDERIDTKVPEPRHSIVCSKRRLNADDSRDSIVRRYHRVDIELVGAKANPVITAKGEVGGFDNYYTNDVEVLGVRSFESVLYSEIYPNIDLEFFRSESGQPEYQFYVKPGGDVKAIRLRYHGANATRLAGDKLEIEVAHGTIGEHIPMSFLGVAREHINVHYAVCGQDEYRFVVTAFDANQTLIIDPMPMLSWGTYYGGSAEDEGYNITCDASSNVYVTGYAASTASIATSGSHQTVCGGFGDCFVVKFNSGGARQWGTYYGGSDYDDGLGITCDANSNVYVTGSTNSTTAIATSGSHQTVRGGSSDCFLVKFNSGGVRQWGTYYGGSGVDYAYGITCDANLNVYVTGSTNSTTAIATSGSHQAGLGGGYMDCFLVKFNSSGIRQWGTYYGGSGDDTGYNITCDANLNVYVTGQTNSTTAIATNGSHQTVLGGNYDCFLVKFNSGGVRQWGTYYGGSDRDAGLGITCDANSNVYVTGVSASTTGMATSGSQQTVLGGNDDCFVVKFNSAGVRQWGTYYGGSDFDGGSEITCDANSNVYVTGTTSSTTAIATSGSHQTVLGGNDDCFVVKFNSGGARQWGTYYGGSDWDEPWGITCDAISNVYVTGYTNSNTSIATSGSHQVTYGGGLYDGFVAKFSPCDSPPTVDPGTAQTICSGDTAVLGTSATNGYTYAWTPKNTLDDSTKSNPKAFPAVTTKYYLSVVNSSGCYKIDSVTVTVNPKPSVSSGTVSDVCVGDTSNYNLTGSYAGHTFSWQALGGSIVGASTNQAVRVNWTRSGADTLLATVTNSFGCSSIGKILLTANSRPTVNASSDKEICSGSSVTLNASASGGTGGLIYSWLPASGLSNAALLQPLASPTTTTAYVLTVNDSKGCPARDTVVVTVNPLPVINAGSDKSICPGFQTQIGNTATGGTGVLSYSWSPASGIVGSNTTPQITVSPTLTTSYVVTVIDAKSCARKDTVVVTVNPKPTINAGEDKVICPNIGAVIGNVASGSTGYSYTWSPATGLSSASVAQPTATPVTTTTYRVVVSDANGCQDSSSVEVRVRAQSATLSSTSLDFGQLSSCDPAKDLSFDITNTGSDDMIISGQSLPAGFILVSALPLSLAKGQKQTIILRFSPSSQGVSMGTVTLIGDPCAYPVTLAVRGEKLHMAYSTDKTSLNYGSSLACNANVEWDSVLTIRNSGSDKMTIRGATFSTGQVFSIVSPAFPQDILPGATLAVTVRYKPLSTGSFSDELQFPFSAGSCTNQIRLPLNAQHIMPNAGITPASISFAQMLGCEEMRDTVITITNSNATDVTVESITGDSQFKVLTSLPLVVPTGESKQIRLRFQPSGTGVVNASLTITTNPCNITSQFLVSGDKQGVSFSSADTIDLGTIVPCAQASITKQATIRNTSGGGVAGSISNVSASSGFTATLKANDALPNAQDVSFIVSFSPTATTPVGITVGKLDLGFQPCDIARTIYLKVNVADVAATADPVIDFGKVQTGLQRTKTINVVNTGSSDMTVATLTGVSAPYSLGTIVPPLPAQLKPRDTLKVEVVFTSQTGTFNQSLKASGSQPCTVQTTSALTATGTDTTPTSHGINATASIVYDSVCVGQKMSLSVTIINTGTTSQQLLRANWITNPSNVFSLAFAPQTLAVGQSISQSIDFAPQSAGLQSGSIHWITDLDSSISTVSGTGKICSVAPDTVTTTVAVRDISGTPGTSVMLELYIASQTGSSAAGASNQFSSLVRFNSNVLYINDGTTSCQSRQGDECVVALSGTKNGTSLKSVPCIITLGNTDNAEISIDDFKWIDGSVINTVTTQNGSIKVQGTCDQGGVRLYIPTSSSASLTSRPSPANDVLNIEYGLVAPSTVTLELLSSAGQVLRTLETNASLAAGLHLRTEDVTALSSGVYFLRLTTSSRVLVARVEVLK